MKDSKYSYNILEAFEDLSREESLKESRSVADIEAEIARLQQELAQAKVADKKASYTNLPTKVWIWDIYLEPSDKGTWTSAELYNGKWDGTVFETKDEAIDAGYYHLRELEDEGELPGRGHDVDDFDVDAFAVNISDVDLDTLEGSDLEHLIPYDMPIYDVDCCICNKSFKVSQKDWDVNKFNCPHCGVELQHD